MLKAMDKILTFKPSNLFEGLKQFKLDEAWKLVSNTFSNGGKIINSLADKLLPTSLKNLTKNLGNVLRKAPGPVKWVGYAFDSAQVAFGKDSPLKEAMKVISATAGSALFGALVQPAATAVPGIGNLFLGAVAAFAGALIGESVGAWLYDRIEKPIIAPIANAVAQVFNQIAQSAKDAIDQGVLNQIFNFVTGTITVYAEEGYAKDAGKLWRQQFGTSYDGQLSNIARSYT